MMVQSYILQLLLLLSFQDEHRLVCNHVRRVLPWAKETIGLSARLCLYEGSTFCCIIIKMSLNRKKRIETYDGQKRMLYLCNVVQERITFALTFRPHTDVVNSSVSHK